MPINASSPRLRQDWENQNTKFAYNVFGLRLETSAILLLEALKDFIEEFETNQTDFKATKVMLTKPKLQVFWICELVKDLFACKFVLTNCPNFQIVFQRSFSSGFVYGRYQIINGE